jgi:hypothetical protein
MITLKEGQLLAKSQSWLYKLLPPIKSYIFLIVFLPVIIWFFEGYSFIEFSKKSLILIPYSILSVSLLYFIWWGFIMLIHKITNGKKRYELFYFKDKLLCSKYKSKNDNIEIPYSNIDKITYNDSKTFSIHFLKPVFGESLIDFYFDLDNCTIGDLVESLNSSIAKSNYELLQKNKSI